MNRRPFDMLSVLALVVGGALLPGSRTRSKSSLGVDRGARSFHRGSKRWAMTLKLNEVALNIEEVRTNGPLAKSALAGIDRQMHEARTRERARINNDKHEGLTGNQFRKADKKRRRLMRDRLARERTLASVGDPEA